MFLPVLPRLTAVLLITLSYLPVAPAPQDALEERLASSFRLDESMEIVRFMAQRWRVRGGGNPGFDESLDHVLEYLRANDFERVGTLEVIEGPLTLDPLAWDPVRASLAIAGARPQELENLASNPLLIAKFSGSTPAAGVVATLVDVGGGAQASDYADLDVRGKIVLARGALGSVYREAVGARGALGVVSDNLRAPELYTSHPGMVRLGLLPGGTAQELRARESWALKVPPATGDMLRERLRAGPVELAVKVETRYFEGPQRALIAELPGATRPQERVVLAAHLDNNAPGAHNNASGVATHAELARVLASAVAAAEIRRPERSITFLFMAEHAGSSMWLERLGERKRGVIVMLNGDMTGLDTEHHGGIYRFERTPDPATYSPRAPEERHPEDRVSGWGFRPFSGEPFPGHYLNDLMWDAIVQRAARSGWRVHQNPYEGGSDHDEYLAAGIPSALSWYWEDPYLSTSLDTPDKVDPLALRHVAVIHGVVALEIASGSDLRAQRLLALIEAGMARRLERELGTARRRLAAARDRESVFAEERAQLALWSTWYEQATRSVTEFVVGEPGTLVSEQVAALVRRWHARVDAAEGTLLELRER